MSEIEPQEPNPLLSLPRSETILVETQVQLQSAISTLEKSSGPFALDAERASGFKYSQRAYLIQIHRKGTPVYLLDPISIAEDSSADTFAALAALLATDEWVLHAASQDIPCLKELGLIPGRLFDTELGSRIIGLPRVSLGAITEHFLKVRLAKEHSAVDWSTRPLHPDWLVYAALDVDVLLELRDAVEAELRKLGKLDWALQEFAHTAVMQSKPPKLDKWRSMSGVQLLKDSRKLAVAKSLWEAREQLAVKLDVSPGRLLPDASVVHVANVLPKSRPELVGDRAFVGRASRSYIDTWWAAVEFGLKSRDLPVLKVRQEGMPNHRTWPTRFPEADSRLKVAKPLIQDLAEKHGLPQENLLTPDYLRQLCWQPPELINEVSISGFLANLGARSWQIALVSAPLAAALLMVDSTDEPSPTTAE